MKQIPLFQHEDVLADEQVWFDEILKSLDLEEKPGWPDEFGAAIRGWLAENKHRPIKTLSLFSGGGGLDIAFHDVGFDVTLMVEIEEKYVDTLRANAGTGKVLDNSNPLCMDIRDFEPPSDLKVDFIIGGPPCQTFSAAGRRAAGVKGIEDPRGTLFEEYVRILKTLKPKGFLFENVYGIVGAQNGEPWRAIVNAFEEAGYGLHYRILDSADYGVPQHRERLFIIGLRNGTYDFPYPTHGPDSIGKKPFYTASEAIKGCDTFSVKEGLGGKYGHLLNDIPPGLNYSFYTEKLGHPTPVFGWRSKFSDFLYKADPEMPVRTVKAQGGQYTGPFHWDNRPFTVDEFKRLQTFPDNYEIIGGKQVQIEQIGNSVPPQIARVLGLSILHQVFGVTLPFPMHYMPPNKELGFRKRKRLRTKMYNQKAQRAISKLKDNGHNGFALKNGRHSEKFTRYISQTFNWDDTQDKKSLKVLVDCDLNDERWKIAIKIEEESVTNPLYKIVIEPNPSWSLPAKKVILVSFSPKKLAFTALWKAFEEIAETRTGIADLVQLSGYYQYQPKMKASFEFKAMEKTDSVWPVIKKVVDGKGVAYDAAASIIAEMYAIDEDDTLSIFQEMRLMGYEIRNNNTNPQIAEGNFLIPYFFPTLNPRSVQLRKYL